MLCQSEGVLAGSDFFFFTPSQMARQQLFYFTSAGHFFCEYGYRVEREDYGNYLFLLVKKGRLSVTTEGKTYQVREGEAAFIDCHTPHEYHAMGVTEFIWMHFDGANTAAFHQDITKNIYDHPVFQIENVKRVEKKMLDILYNLRYDKFCTEYEDSLHIYEILIEVITGKSGKWKSLESQKDQVIEIAVRYIGENYNKNLSVKNIADHVGLSESHFNRKFRQVMNASPKEYVIRKRMNEAKHLLKTTSSSIKEISLQVGFNSESHFTNSFTAQNGISPKKFREFPL